jgi:3-methyladenine DNA glycosylase Tag
MFDLEEAQAGLSWETGFSNAQAFLAVQFTTGDFTEACGWLKWPLAVESCYRPQSRVRVH